MKDCSSGGLWITLFGGEWSAVMGEVSKFIPFPNMEDVALCLIGESTERIGGSNCCATSWFRLGFRMWFGLGFSLGFGLMRGLRFGFGLVLGFGLGLGLGFKLELGLVIGCGLGLGMGMD